MNADPRLQQIGARAQRLAAGDTRSYVERVADALTALTDVIEEQRNDQQRMHAWSDAISFVGHRASADFRRTTGDKL